MKYKSIFILYCSVLGLVVGSLSALFLILVNGLIHLVWNKIPEMIGSLSLYPLIVGIIGGILVGCVQTYMGAYPRTMHETIGEFKVNKKIEYKNRIGKNFISALIVLAFGASLGPEAALSSILGGLISWVGDQMKWNLARKNQLVELSLGAMMAAVFRAPFVGISEKIEIDVKQSQIKNKWNKIILYGITAFFGFLGFKFINGLFPKETVFEIRVMSIDWDIHGLLIYLPCVILGLLFGYFFLYLEKETDKLAQFIKNPFVLSISAGVLIGVFGIISPYFLFSGEHEIFPLSVEYERFSILFLLFLGIGKALLTNICFSFGWRGGKIFPAIFSSASIGLAAAQLLPYMPGLTVGIVVASSVTIIMKQPLVTAAVLFFLLPIQFFPIILITCLLVRKSDLIISKK